jgi:hypothetical protein
MAVIARQASAALIGEMRRSSSTPTCNGSGRTAPETPAGLATCDSEGQRGERSDQVQPAAHQPQPRNRLPFSSCLGTRLWPRSRLRCGPRTW